MCKESQFPQRKIGFILLIYLAGLLPSLREMICVKLFSAWHRVIQANKMIIHLMDLETETQEGAGQRPHIKLIVDPETGREVRFGRTLEVGNKQMIHTCFLILFLPSPARYQAGHWARKVQAFGLQGPRSLACCCCGLNGGRYSESRKLAQPRLYFLPGSLLAMPPTFFTLTGT